MDLKQNNEFMSLVNPIVNNSDFIKTQDTIHHGIKKFDHSIKVSYYSYKIAKKLNFDYESVARAGLLHDYFLSNTNGKSLSKKALKLTYKHHNIALRNSRRNFKLNKLEEDIIVKHMFPVIPKIPKYKESFLVAFVDKIIGTHEFLSKFNKLLNYKILSQVIPSFMIFTNIIK